MIQIKIGDPIKLKPTPLSPKSGFISFPYDSQLVEYIKSLGNRVYLPESKMWEVPLTAVPTICNKLTTRDIEIVGEMVKETKTQVQLPKGFTFTTQPYNHQLEGVLYGLANDTFLLGDDQGLGKALSLDTKIYTPTGYKLMKDIKVGDYVFNRTGTPVKVTNTFYHKNVEMYKFTFSDGKQIKCCKDHLWKVYDQEIPKVVDTNWFLLKNHRGVVRKDALRNSTNYNYRIDRCLPAKFNKQSIPLDAYVVGVLLGDGSITADARLTTTDEFILDEIQRKLPDGIKVYQPSSLKGTIDYYIGRPLGTSAKRNEVTAALSQLNLIGCNSHTKFIPDCYKYNTIEIRRAILQGLLDTDGYASADNLLQYTTVSKQLCEDVEFLVESLGGMAVIGECKGAYTITIRIDNPQELVMLPRKKSRLQPRKFKPCRYITNIERIDNSDAKCITVDDSESLYLAEHFIVTHNTKEIIDLAIARKHSEGMKHCLIICGVNGTKYNWVDEVHTHSKEDAWVIGTRYTKRAPVKMIEGTSKDKLDDLMNLPPHFFIITNIETLRAMPTKKGNKTVFPIAERIQKLCDMGQIGMVAFDEAHKAKNPTSQQGKALLSIQPKYAIPMSGTFLVNSPLDLYVPLKWAGFEQHSFYQYKQHYCVMGGFNNQEVISYKNLDEIRAILDKVMLRRTKDEVLDLPPKIHTVEYVEMNKEQKTIYDEVKKEVKSSIDKLRISNDPLSQMIRLRQATGYPGILSSTITQSAKMDRMVELIEEITSVGQKAIVYSQWEQMTLIMKQKLKRYNPAYITGDVKSEIRMQEVSRFQNDPTCKVIIGTIGAMGTGLTLTAASNVIFIDDPWNRALKDQAEDRAHRIGTKGTVRVITIVCKETIDERILDLVYRKGKMADLLIDGKFEGRNKTAFIDYLLS